jgi:hypothetical protein
MQKNTIDASDDLFIGHAHKFEHSLAFIYKKTRMPMRASVIY